MSRGDIGNLPFPSGSFDLVVCNHVLEHVVDDQRAMRELRRVMSVSGCLLVQVPIERDATLEDPTATDPASRLQLFGQEDHVRSYGRDFALRLMAAGLEVREDPFAARLPEEAIRRFGLVRDETIFMCTIDSRVQ